MPVPTQYPPVITHIIVRDAQKAIEFYKAAFGATELYRLIVPGGDKIGHAELLLNGQVIMLAEEWPGYNKSPDTLGGTTFSFCVMVKNADEAIQRAVKAGATVTMPPMDMFYGYRSGSVRDPFGHQWMLQHEQEKLTPEEMQQRWNSMVDSGTSPT